MTSASYILGSLLLLSKPWLPPGFAANVLRTNPPSLKQATLLAVSVECREDGHFPHPFSCQHFVRCHDPTGMGKYWAYVRECPPGTLFSMEERQCIHKDTVSQNSLKSCSSSAQIPKNPVPKPWNCTKSGIFVDPSSCESYIECVDPKGFGYFWKKRRQCPPGTLFSESVTACISKASVSPAELARCAALSSPSPPLSSSPSPPASSSSSPTTPTVFPQAGPPGPPPSIMDVPVPSAMPLNPVGPPVDTAAPPSQVNSSQILTPDTTIEKAICSVSLDKECQARLVCLTQAIKTLCRAHEKCYFRDKLIHEGKYCKDGEEFDPETNECLEYCEPPPSQVMIIPSLKTELRSVTCSPESLMPNDPWIIQNYCHTYAMCNTDDTFKEMKLLCNSFYVCIRSDNQQWTALLTACSGQMLYDMTERKCVDRPSGSSLCTGFPLALDNTLAKEGSPS